MNKDKNKEKLSDNYCYKDKVQEEIGRLISRLYRLQYTKIGEKLKKLDITALHSTILVNIHRFPNLTQNNLSSLLSIDKAVVSRVLSILEKKKYIIKTIPLDNRRLYNLNLTEEGLEIVVKSLKLQEKIWDEILQNITQQEKQFFLDTLILMFKNINESPYD